MNPIKRKSIEEWFACYNWHGQTDKQVIFQLQQIITSERNAALDEAAKTLKDKLASYVLNHGNLDHDTGTLEFPKGGDEYVAELEEQIEAILSLK